VAGPVGEDKVICVSQTKMPVMKKTNGIFLSQIRSLPAITFTLLRTAPKANFHQEESHCFTGSWHSPNIQPVWIQ
jgi:hypothetical protein